MTWSDKRSHYMMTPQSFDRIVNRMAVAEGLLTDILRTLDPTSALAQKIRNWLAPSETL